MVQDLPEPGEWRFPGRPGNLPAPRGLFHNGQTSERRAPDGHLILLDTDLPLPAEGLPIAPPDEDAGPDAMLIAYRSHHGHEGEYYVSRPDDFIVPEPPDLSRFFPPEGEDTAPMQTADLIAEAVGWRAWTWLKLSGLVGTLAVSSVALIGLGVWLAALI